MKAFAAISTLLLAPALAAAAPLSLRDALERAAHEAYGVRAQASTAEAMHADARRPLQGILPGVRLEAGYMRTTLPLNAFGFLLQQRQVTPLAFDPRSLNDPNAISNWNTAAVAEVPLVNLDAWAARSAAKHAAAAADASTAWTREETQRDVLRAYYGVVLAREQVATLEEALTAARAHVAQASSLEQAGVVTAADALLASVKAGDVEVRLDEARRAALLAVKGLALAMGADDHEAIEVSAALPDAATVTRLADTLAPDTAAAGERADLRASAAQAEAAASDATRSTAMFLPRLNAVGRLDWNSADALFAGRSSWTVGVMASWAPFSGGSEIAALQAARARASAARTMVEASRAQASLDAQRAADALAVARLRLRTSESAVAQSQEAHRIVASKYDGGLASVTELLEASAQETASRLGFADVRYSVITAVADQRHALGLDIARVATALESL